MPSRRVLVLGGARSGKSSFAERLALELGEPVVYVATASAVDDEMAARIAHHRARRPPDWQTVEARTDLAAAVAPARTLLVEDLTLLLSNYFERDIASAEEHVASEIDALLTLEANVILVSNEVGMALVPENALGRNFRDALGRVNQHAAAICDEVYFVVAGLPLRMK
jgi:adenosylcobinamide kinase/adenosylcobinamide-phosphate guanylyltransferase